MSFHSRNGVFNQAAYTYPRATVQHRFLPIIMMADENRK